MVGAVDKVIRRKQDPMIEREKQKVNLQYLMKMQKAAPKIYNQTITEEGQK